MIQVTITRNSQVTNSASFPTESEAHAWYDSHLAMGSFGPAASTQTIQVELTPAVLDENGVETSPATFEEQEIQIEGHSVSFVDISAQEAQEAANIAAKAFLDSTDWYIIRALESSVPVPKEILEERATARSRVVR